MNFYIEDGFKIFHRIFYLAYRIKKERKKMMQNFNLSEAEAQILFFLGLNHGEVENYKLVNFYQKHKSTIRQKLKTLEEKDLIIFEKCNDERKKKIRLSQKGAKLFKKILSLNTEYQNSVLQKFSEKEKKTLIKLLDKFFK